MPITIAVPKETAEGEKRVALTPDTAKKLAATSGATVAIETGAGAGIFMPDAVYEGCEIVDTATALGADVVLKVRPPNMDEVRGMKRGAVLISFMQAHLNHDVVKELQARDITCLAMEFIPRTTRGQAMDALSSQANVAGYKVALMAAELLGRYFPMLTTAAGTIRPAQVLIVGAGVAGLQAIATCRRLGAIVSAFDVRPEVKEQIESLGAKFVDTGVSATSEGGYARELTAEERAQQQAALEETVAKMDAVITTASVPGRKAPQIISAAVVDKMKNGAVIIDLAAETGGNCELTKAGETIVHGTTTIHGPVNIPSMMGEHASEQYAKNMQNLLALMVADGELTLNWEDDIVEGSCLTHAGEIKHAGTKEQIEGA